MVVMGIMSSVQVNKNHNVTMHYCSRTVLPYRMLFTMMSLWLFLSCFVIVEPFENSRYHFDLFKDDHFSLLANNRVKRQAPLRTIMRHNPIVTSSIIPETLFEARKKTPRPRDDGRSCPSKCKCTNRREVQCNFRLLKELPEDVPATVKKFNLAYNKLVSLRSSAFTNYSRTLRYLYLQSNALQMVQGAFNHLTHVEILRLSWNKLTSIRKLLLVDVISLKRLYIDNNKINFIHPEAFRGLTKLTLLQLEGNRLSHLHPDTFITMRFEKYFSFSHIQHLHLSNNQFQVLPRSLLTNINNLRQVYLHGNPWECSCHLQWLHQWLRESGKYRCKQSILRRSNPPTCAQCSTPYYLKDQVITQVSHDNITCSPPHFIGDDSGQSESELFSGDDPTFMELENDDTLFTLGSQEKPSMSIKIDGITGSLVFLVCKMSRNPVTSVKWNDVNEIYVGSFEATMKCDVEHPKNGDRTDFILKPYLNSALNFSTGGQLLPTSRGVQYNVTFQSEPLEPLAPLGSGLRIAAAEILSTHRVFKSPSATITIFGNHFRPEEGELGLLYQNMATYRQKDDVRLRDFPWTMAGKPSSTTMDTHLAMQNNIKVLQCRAMGFPRPMLSWILPDKTIVTPSRRSGRFKVTRTGRLVIRRVTEDDSGVYRCLSQSFQVEGAMSEDIGSLRLHVVKYESDSTNTRLVNVEEGGDWSWNCSVEAVPNAAIGWLMPNHKLLIGQKQVVADKITTTEDGSIFIKQINKQKEGLYRCIAANRMGYLEKALFLQVVSSEQTDVTTVRQQIRRKTGSNFATTTAQPTTTTTTTTITTTQPTTTTTTTTTTATSVATTKPTTTMMLTNPEVTTKAIQTTTKTTTSTIIQAAHTDSPKIIRNDEVTISTVDQTEITATSLTTSGVVNSNEDAPDNSTATDSDVVVVPPLKVQHAKRSNDVIEKYGRDEDESIPSQDGASDGDNFTVPDEESVMSQSSSESKEKIVHPNIIAVKDDDTTTDNKQADQEGEKEREENPMRDTEEIIEINYGESLHISCPLKNGSEISWSFAPHSSPNSRRSRDSFSEVVSSVHLMPKMTINGSRDILISETTEQHNGTLVCRNMDKDIHRYHLIVTYVPPRITEPGHEEITVEYGKSTTVPCAAEGFPPPDITWSWPIRDVIADMIAAETPTTSLSRAYTKPRHVLHLDTVSPSFAVTYICKASNPAGSAMHPVLVIVSYLAPTLDHVDERVSAGLGDVVRLDCSARAIPPPKYTWILSNGESLVGVNVTSSGREVLSNGSLVINDVKRKDAGSYGCIVSNEVGEVSVEITLQIIERKTLRNQASVSPTTEVASNASITLTTTSITSIKSTTLAPTTKMITQTATTPTTTSTTSIKPTVSPVATKTTTQTTTTATTATTQATTTTTTTTKATSTKEGVDSNGKNKTISVYLKQYRISGYVFHDRTAYLRCRTRFPKQFSSGQRRRFRKPTFTVRWTTPSGDKAAFPYPVPSRRHRVFKNGTLRVRDTELTDTGVYICIAQDKLGRQIRTVVNLTIATQPPTLQQHAYSAMRVRRGRSASADCSAIGYPTPHITWLTPTGGKYGSGAFGNGLRVQPGGRLVVYRVNVGNAGKYVCMASNIAGNVSRVVTFELQGFSPRIKSERTASKWAKVGQSIKLLCSAEGVPKPRKYWTLPGGRSIKLNEGIFEKGETRSKFAVLSSGTLTINRVIQKDAGYYRCYAENRMGTDVKTVNLKVYH